MFKITWMFFFLDPKLAKFDSKKKNYRGKYMTIAVASGFMLLSVLGGFALNKMIKNDRLNLGGSSGVIDMNNEANAYYPSKGTTANTDIISYPFSMDNPDFTGAVYIGADWFLMANGMFFNRVSKKWCKDSPLKDSDNNEKDKDKNVAPLVGSAVKGGVSALLKGSKIVVLALVGLGAFVIKKINDNKENKE